MNTKEIKEILSLMKEHDLSEIEIEKEGMKLVVRKNGSGQFFMQQPQFTSVPAMQQNSAASSAPANDAAQVSSGKSAGATEVRSPMVGTFYSSPGPDQPQYVTVGQTVSEGDVLCIIEAMKLMNEIKAEISGVVEKILVKNGDPIEFDQPLFYIK
jgi:acetyl-CoA carboxylase biotin carboxyl carrier protein